MKKKDEKTKLKKRGGEREKWKERMKQRRKY